MSEENRSDEEKPVPAELEPRERPSDNDRPQRNQKGGGNRR
jgi:hypothetical protein